MSSHASGSFCSATPEFYIGCHIGGELPRELLLKCMHNSPHCVGAPLTLAQSPIIQCLSCVSTLISTLPNCILETPFPSTLHLPSPTLSMSRALSRIRHGNLGNLLLGHVPPDRGHGNHQHRLRQADEDGVEVGGLVDARPVQVVQRLLDEEPYLLTRSSSRSLE